MTEQKGQSPKPIEWEGRNERLAPCVHSSGNYQWAGGTEVEYATFDPFPPGTEVRMLVIRKGSLADLFLTEFHKPEGLGVHSITLQQFHYNNIVDGQVLSFTLTKVMRIGLWAGGAGFWLPSAGMGSSDAWTTDIYWGSAGPSTPIPEQWHIALKLVLSPF